MAELPFQPAWPFNYIVNNSEESQLSSKLCSATFLYILTFVALKNSVKKLFFKTEFPSFEGEAYAVIIPAHFYTNLNGTFLKFFKGFFFVSYFTVFYYSILKKQQSTRYHVSFTRFMSRIVGFLCSLHLPTFLRYFLAINFFL